jgi:Asp-tRNA(Asn)/Glu-tRNA(Gln) amidotransferase A subunit family amidase
LHCVVSLTEELALKQAEQADREIAAGRYRVPLHGIPWGAKDLIAYPGYKTTWGAAPFKEQTLDFKATVARRLDEAGAVLMAKLTLGALAMGDRWFGGMTRNPWDPKQGSSGSSAGSASATVAGLVGFALGSETLGSIVSPCIHGFDGLDASAVERPFSWPCSRDLRTLKVGYIEGNTPADKREDLRVLRDLGVKLVPIKLPSKYPLNALRLILGTEAAVAFDELTRAGVTEGLNSWPQQFRQGQFVPAVEYLRANRIRTLLMQEMEESMAGVDLYVGGNDLLLTNLTGHPTAVLPNGFRKRNDGSELPDSIKFTGRLYGETELLAVAHAYQQATGHHLRRPKIQV